jgi:DNA-binding GntR family transcriptional regulator
MELAQHCGEERWICIFPILGSSSKFNPRLGWLQGGVFSHHFPIALLPRTRIREYEPSVTRTVKVIESNHKIFLKNCPLFSPILYFYPYYWIQSGEVTMALSLQSDLAMSRRIAVSLKDEILAGKYPPGVRIRQEDIAKRFKSSRSPVREALRMLEADGLAKLVAHTGSWIAQLSLVECEEMYQIRERIEPLMLRMSIPHLTTEKIDGLAQLAVEMEKNNDIEVFLKIDREFHLLSYAGAQTAHLGEMVQRLWNTTQHYRRAYSQLLVSDNFKSAHYEHHLLLSAIAKVDLDDAERILFGHIRRTRLELAQHPHLFPHRLDKKGRYTDKSGSG